MGFMSLQWTFTKSTIIRKLLVEVWAVTTHGEIVIVISNGPDYFPGHLLPTSFQMFPSSTSVGRGSWRIGGVDLIPSYGMDFNSLVLDHLDLMIPVGPFLLGISNDSRVKLPLQALSATESMADRHSEKFPFLHLWSDLKSPIIAPKNSCTCWHQQPTTYPSSLSSAMALWR